MDEELIEYLFASAKKEGYKKSKDDFINLINSDDDVLDYLHKGAAKEGYKGDFNKFSALVRGNKTPITKEEESVVPNKELSGEPMATVKAQQIPGGPTNLPTVDVASVPAMEVKSLEGTPTQEEPMTAEKKEVIKSDIESKLLPVTEKTEIKAIETPSDKMVIKSETKAEEPKVEVKPTEVAKIEVKQTEVKDIPSYGNIDKNTDIGGGVFTDKTKISSNLDAKELSPKEILDGELLTKGWYKIELNRNVSSRYPDPPNVDAKNTIKSENVGVFKPIKIGEENYYTNYDKDSKKWYLYKEGSSDNEWKELKNGAIKSMLNSKLLNNNGEPIKEQIDYTEKDANEINLAKKKLAYSKYLQYLVNNFDDLTEKEQQQVKDVMQQDQYDKYYRWISHNVDDPKVIDFWIKALEKTNTDSYYLEEIKKKKNNLIPTEESKVEVKEVPAVSDKMVIKSEAKVEAVEGVKGVPSYDDLGIEKGTNLLTNTPYYLPKGMKYKEMSPSEIISTVVDENGFVSRNGIKLNRNTSIRYPDPPGTVFKKEKVGERELYSSYDKSNGKWYIYDANSNKDNWTEVETGPIKTLLNSKFPDKENKEKIDKVTEDEEKLIDNTRNSVYVNVYMPYLLKNEDKLSDEESLKLQKMIKGIAHFKTLEAHFKEEPFTGSLEDYLEKKNKNISDTREMPEIESITDKKHLQIINDIVARTDNENGYFKDFFESKSYPTENFSYSELENRKSNNELDLYKSILGTVFYDKNKDEFYWTEYDKKRIAREKYNHVYEGDKLDFDEKSQLPYLVIKKGTPDYDKIKSSLSKYNK